MVRLTQSVALSALVFALFLATVSAVCSLLLWVSFTNNLLDASLAAVTSLALVGVSYVFIPVLLRLREQRRWGFFSGVLALELALVMSSLGATVGWLESNYQRHQQHTMHGSEHYQQQQQQLDNINSRIILLTTLAQQDSDNGYRQRAMAALAQADILNQERRNLLQQTPNATAEPATNAGSTLATALGQHRYILWSTLALLLDGCPMVCFAIVNLQPRPRTTPTAIEKPPVATPSEPAHEPEHEMYAEIAREIKAGRWGDKPALRNVITDKKIRHATAKDFFQRYLADGTLTKSGTRFERVA